MPTVRQTLIDLSLILAIGLLLALIGPFGSFGAPFAWRLVYWTALALAGYFLYMPVVELAERLAARLDLPEFAMLVASCLVATVPMTAIVWLAGQLPGPIEAPTLAQAVNGYGRVLVIGAGITLLFRALARRGERDAAEKPPAPPPGPPAELELASAPRLLDRLPPHLGRNLVALEMEDHYVRAHTRSGSGLILMRMRDAVAELDGLPGAQVHRSWWVARDAVEQVSRDGRNVRLRLVTGIEAPVARGTAGALREAGWF